VEGNCRQFFLELVPNRKWDTILEVFNECILQGTIIFTDGYPSYPRAVETFGSEHERVNHSLGVVNETGGRTNQIENIWSHMKQDYRRKGGINHDRITLWIDEFSWKKRKLNYSNVCSVNLE
jgi:transposase-like protein